MVGLFKLFARCHGCTFPKGLSLLHATLIVTLYFLCPLIVNPFFFRKCSLRKYKRTLESILSKGNLWPPARCVNIKCECTCVHVCVQVPSSYSHSFFSLYCVNLRSFGYLVYDLYPNRSSLNKCSRGSRTSPWSTFTDLTTLNTI